MANFTDLDESQLEQIRDSLWSRQYYLLTGSGISLDSRGPNGAMESAQALRERLCQLVDIPNNRSLQQAYSLLDQEAVLENITRPFKCLSPGSTVQKIASYPWRRIFTLNVDNCLQTSITSLVSDPKSSLHQIEIKHFSDDFSETSPVNVQSMIHLHGLVDRPSDGYIFSHSEYAKNISRPNSWMITLVQLIRGDPFLICGTTLDEIDFTYYVEQRSSRSVRSDTAPSILIEPFPDKLTHRLCEQHELYLFEGTTLEFFAFFESRFGAPAPYWLEAPPDGLDGLALSSRDKIAFAATFELVPKSAQADGRAAPFLLGAPLSWPTLEGRADISREVTPGLQRAIQSAVRDTDVRVLLLLDEPGSGKSALLKRLAFQIAKQERSVFYFTGSELIEEESCAAALDAIVGNCFIFVDDWADHSSYFARVLDHLKRSDIIFVGTERTYRRPYIENGLADEDISFVESQLDLTRREAGRLISKFGDQGLSAIGRPSEAELIKLATQISGDPISIASCRIQNNFYTFDKLVSEILKEVSEDEIMIFVTVGISRYCYAGGVQRSVLFQARQSSRIEEMLNIYAKLPIVYGDYSKQFVVPARSAVADRVISILRRDNPNLLLETFVDLSNAIAPRVNRQQISIRSPAAKLSGALMDFDRVIKRFINDHAEAFYDSIGELWKWNSRYWEQCALLKLDRYLADKSDKRLLEEAIQNARYAYSIELHPLSLTTLAKMLFVAIDESTGSRDEVFEEGWNLISQSIDIESRWATIRSTAFVVCFNGVLAYLREGGTLTGEQAERLRDIIAITYQRKLRDGYMSKLRDEVSSAVSGV